MGFAEALGWSTGAPIFKTDLRCQSQMLVVGQTCIMADVALFKRWKISEALLNRAHRALPRPDKSAEDQFGALEKQFFEYLTHNEHELALDMLQEAGDLVAPRGGFWKDLIRAAENMGLSKRIPYFESRFQDALSQLQRK